MAKTTAMIDGADNDPAVDGPRYTVAWQHLRKGGDSGMFVFRVPDHTPGTPHDHVFHEIVLVEAGTAEHETVEGIRKLRPGDVIVIRPQIWHGYRSSRGLSIINCLIDSLLMQRLGPLLAQVSGAFELLRQRPRDPRRTPPTVLHASPAQRAVLQARLETIMAEQRTRVDGWQSAATAALLDALVLVARLGHGQAQAPAPVEAIGDRSEQAVMQVATLLETHYAEPVSLEDLAQHVHLSPGHLSRSFSRRMGMGIVQYVHRIRAEEACRLLRFTDEPIARIASRVGYDEIAYFSRCFRAQMHQSPMEYRKALQGRV
jgi:AraC family transcriptional regulator, L-rhamnose operon transcriptional activator RhaR